MLYSIDITNRIYSNGIVRSVPSYSTGGFIKFRMNLIALPYPFSLNNPFNINTPFNFKLNLPIKFN
jgi:hypothetical protein